jgi:histidine ammonia-lyase
VSGLAPDPRSEILTLTVPADLGPAAVRAVADGRRIELDPSLLDALARVREAALERLEAQAPVYGVTTGMGDQSRVTLDVAARERHQDTLMLGRAVGSPPWLPRPQARATLATRLRTFLGGDAAVSPELCQRLVDLLNADVVPAVPATGSGAAGEILVLAHVGGLVTGSGAALAPDGLGARPARDALADAGLHPLTLGTKEGVALLQGVPTTTALAILSTARARALADRVAVVSGIGIAVIGASRDPYLHVLARADDELAVVLSKIREVAGDESTPRHLQAPLSFRIIGPALAHTHRCVGALEAAVERALAGVTDSPAFIGGTFVGTAGFDGFDLAAGLDALTLAACRLAETSAARLHRLLDDRVTGLPRQLSDLPGLHAGMVAVHKRAVGVVHLLRRGAGPSSLGSMETSLGQEDVQCFSVEAARSAESALEALTEVLACELLALHQAVLLGGPTDRLGAAGSQLLAEAAAVLPGGTSDRPFGRDVDALVRLLTAVP